MSLDIYLYAKADVGKDEPIDCELYWRNCTHNLAPMWHLAGVYDALYKSNNDTAEKYIEVLEKGIADMEARPEEYKELNPPNGWGNYEGALNFLKDFTNNCKEYPKSIIGVSK